MSLSKYHMGIFRDASQPGGRVVRGSLNPLWAGDYNNRKPKRENVPSALSKVISFIDGDADMQLLSEINEAYQTLAWDDFEALMKLSETELHVKVSKVLFIYDDAPVWGQLGPYWDAIKPES